MSKQLQAAAAHKFAQRTLYADFGLSMQADLSGAVERLLAESWDSSVRYDMPDPERDAWDRVWELEQHLLEIKQGHMLKKSKEWIDAYALSSVVKRTQAAFGLF